MATDGEKADRSMNIMGKIKKKRTKNDIFFPSAMGNALTWTQGYPNSLLNDGLASSLDVKLIDLCVQITISIVLLQGKEELWLFATRPCLRGHLFQCRCMSLVQRNPLFLRQDIGFLKKCIKIKGN